MVTPVLAPTVACFKDAGVIRQVEMHQRAPHRITNQGLEFESRALQLHQSKGNIFLIELNCYTFENGKRATCLLAVTDRISHSSTLERTWPQSLGQELWSLFISPTYSSSTISRVEKKFLIRTQPRPEVERITTPGWQLSDTMTSLERRYELLKGPKEQKSLSNILARFKSRKKEGLAQHSLPHKAWTA